MSVSVTTATSAPDAPEDVVGHRGWFGALWRSRNGRIGVIIVGIVLVAGLLGIWGISPYGPVGKRWATGQDLFPRTPFGSLNA